MHFRHVVLQVAATAWSTLVQQVERAGQVGRDHRTTCVESCAQLGQGENAPEVTFHLNNQSDNVLPLRADDDVSAPHEVRRGASAEMPTGVDARTAQQVNGFRCGWHIAGSEAGGPDDWLLPCLSQAMQQQSGHEHRAGAIVGAHGQDLHPADGSGSMKR